MRHSLPHLHPAEAPVSSASSRRPAPRHPQRPVSRVAGAQAMSPLSQIDAAASVTCRVTAAAALRCLGW
jgi:hypothetical protein